MPPCKCPTDAGAASWVGARSSSTNHPTAWLGKHTVTHRSICEGESNLKGRTVRTGSNPIDTGAAAARRPPVLRRRPDNLPSRNRTAIQRATLTLRRMVFASLDTRWTPPRSTAAVLTKVRPCVRVEIVAGALEEVPAATNARAGAAVAGRRIPIDGGFRTHEILPRQCG